MEDQPKKPIPDPKDGKGVPEQKFTINSDGSIDIPWIEPKFSDVIFEIAPDEKKNAEDLNKGKKPRIFCG